jgi:folate-dependent phosphoribosylglycinamide formyltransferase PurN
MSIVILVGGQSSEANVEHRYLVQAFVEHFGDKITRVISAEPQQDPLPARLKRAFKRGQYLERIRRSRYQGPFGPDGDDLAHALFGDTPPATLAGGDRRAVVSSHNGRECEQLLDKDKPEVIVVYGTKIIRENIFSRARIVTLNMHTGLSPYYRGDSTLFWPVYFDDPENLGVTVHKLAASVDGGDIIYTGKVQYSSGDSEADLFAKGVKVGTELYLKAVEDALGNRIEYHPQDLSIGREFRWIHRTVAAEHQVKQNLARWAEKN